MPRTYPPRRPLLGVKVSVEGIAAIDAQAERAGVARSDWVRAALSAALAKPATVTPYLPKKEKL